MIRLLLADPDTDRATDTLATLQQAMSDPLRGQIADSADGCLSALNDTFLADCVVIDGGFFGGAGRCLLDDLFARDRFLPVIVLVDDYDGEHAIAAMRRGARDVLRRGADLGPRLGMAVADAISRAETDRRDDDRREMLQSFADVLVHDLRAPLRSVRGGVDMLMEDLEAPQQQTHAEVLGFIRDGAEHMDRLIVDLHRHCAVTSAAQPRAEVDLSAVVDKLRMALSADIARRGAEVSVVSPLPVIRGDETQLSQLLQNLIANGLKFNEAAVPLVQLSCEDRGDLWRISITDNGIGIDSAYTEEIFQPLRRLHSDSEYEGTGLGLSICTRIARRHGGRLSCVSEQGQGTTFHLDLPKTRADVIGLAVGGDRAASAG